MKTRRLAVYLIIAMLLLGSAYIAWRRPSIDGIKRRVNMAVGTAVAFASPPQSNPALQLADIPFDLVEIDGDVGGDVKLVGDIDGDGFPDLILGGITDEKLNWYHYPTWQKTVIATPNNEFTTDGRLGDVDGDGDLDIVVPDGDGPDNLVWFENPRPSGDPFSGETWTRHTIGTIGSWGKDVHVADFDDDGFLDVATRRQDAVMIFFQTAVNTWSQVDLSGLNTGNEGMTSGDVDGDGHVDLVLRGQWAHNPGGAAARIAANWTPYDIGAADSDFKALVVDLDQDGRMDILFSSSENTADVDWWSADNGDPTGAWTRHTILPGLEKAHTLQAADMDLDGDLDVVLGQMHTSAAQEIMILFNVDGQATSWEKQVVGTGGLHNGVVADIGNDGDYDIYGANWTGNPPVRLWENRLDAAGALDRWTYKQITDQHAQTFGLGFGDLDGDGRIDILSGRYWYANPGGDLLGDWPRREFPADMHAFLTLNVDGDDLADVLAQKSEGDLVVYWLEATDAAATDWTAVRVGDVPAASHELGAQGYRTAVLSADSPPVVAISSGNGIYYFTLPADPSAGDWPRVHVSANPSDEGFAFGDVDGDGYLDVAATTGDSKRVEWYRNPGDGSDDWAAFPIGTFDEALYPDRTELADLNGDGRLDIIVTEENGEASDAQTFWWAQPADPTSGDWPRSLIVSQATTNSLDAADMDGDGDIDLVLAEHRGRKATAVWINDGQGNFTEKLVDEGQESHLGGQTVDLDGDGDLDIVSIAYDESQFVHLWRNDELNRLTTTSDSAATPEVMQPEAAETAVPPEALADSAAIQGPLALYTFAEGAGNVVRDVSGVGEPLDLLIGEETAVTWLPDGGLLLQAPTILATEQAAAKLNSAIPANNELTLAVWLKPASVDQDGPARIVSLSFDPFYRNLTLGQEFGAYDVRLRSSATSENGVPSLITADNVVTTDLVHLVYTRDASGQATLYQNGEVAAAGQIGGDLAGWDASYRLALGNEFSLDRPWLGEYHRLALYGRALTAAEVAEQFQAGPDAPIAQPEPTTLPPTEVATTDVVATAVPDAVSSAASPQPESTATALLPEPETAVFSPGILAVGVSVMAILVLGGFFVLRRRN